MLLSPKIANFVFHKQIEALKADIAAEKKNLSSQKEELADLRKGRALELDLLHILFDERERVLSPKEHLIETMGKILGPGRHTEIIQNYLRCGCSLVNMDSFGLTMERRRQIIQKGFNRFISRLEEYDSIVEDRKQLRWEVDMLRKEKENLQKRLRELLPELKLADDQARILAATIRDCGFSARRFNVLTALKVRNVRELLTHSEEELSKCRNFGRKSIQEVNDFCAKFGLQLAPNE